VNASTSVIGTRWNQKWSNSRYIIDGCSSRTPLKPRFSVAVAMFKRSKLEISTCLRRPRCSMIRASLRERNSSGE